VLVGVVVGVGVNVEVAVGVGVGKGQVPISVIVPVPSVITTEPCLAHILLEPPKQNTNVPGVPLQLVQVKVVQRPNTEGCNVYVLHALLSVGVGVGVKVFVGVGVNVEVGVIDGVGDTGGVVSGAL
jgi:ABC-type phosphate transport system substrate-binding protein